VVDIRETKSAVIGLGFMGKVHCENIRRLPYVKLQAVVEENEDTLRRYQLSQSSRHGVELIKDIEGV